MQRSEKDSKKHSVEWTARFAWTPGALKAAVAALAIAVGLLARFWQDIMAVVGLSALLIIAFTPDLSEDSPEDAAFRTSMVRPKAFFTCDIPHFRRGAGSSLCLAGGASPYPAPPSPLILAGAVFPAAPVLLPKIANSPRNR